MTTLRAKALKLFQLKRRLEEADDTGYCTCVTCGVSDHYTKMHGGHWIPKGSSSALAFDSKNVHAQCPGCNLFGMKYGSAAQAYTLFMIQQYGEIEVERMLARRNETVKIYTAEYREMIKTLNAEIKQLKSRML
ncbi:MAG: recombination protein NinG [Pirellulales bacterium]|nr:recombination protein NinG [Pirellulales bacterium]